MNKFRFIRIVFLTQILMLFPFVGPAQADDTEIFFNIKEDVSAPNILFILDNSGSMATEVQVLSSDYDASQNYTGNYSNDYIYYNSGWRYKSVLKSAVECQDIFGKLDSLGHTAPYKMAYYKDGWVSRGWRTLSGDITERTVCQADGNNNDVSWGNIEAHEFYSGNYLNWYTEYRGVTYRSRLSIVKQVAKDLADGLEGVNIGLMAFDKQASDYGEGGVVLEPVRPVSQGRESFKRAVDSLGADTNTPLAETLLGAKRYFQGAAPFLSATRNQASTAMSGSEYDSPINLQCQANYVVLLTDGVPTLDDNHNSEIKKEIDAKRCTEITNDNGKLVQDCLPEIAGYMRENDIHSDFPEDQRVTTYTVGFQTNQDLLQAAATRGGGEYYQVESADQLAGVFNEIFRQVLSTNTTFASPGVSVNNLNQLSYLDALYFSVFEPNIQPLWRGNLKRYRLTPDGDIVDRNGNEAIDPVTGFFRDTAQSYWSSSVDGAVAGAGGAASKIPGDNSLRKVYTYYQGSVSKSLTSAVNQVSVNNSANLTKTLLGDPGMTDQRQSQLIRWIRGQDVEDSNGDGSISDSRKFIADPLHSRPYLQIYGGTAENPDTAVFFGDNQGFLHAVDGQTGQLYFSFIPGELLANQGTLLDNNLSGSSRPYGMDGSVTAWFQDQNQDQVVDEGDSVYIYSGMRRGGRNYYGLDVSNRNAPSVLWVIRGGEGDFSELGQTWSDPVRHRVRLGNEIRDVLLFSGGYDPLQDEVGVRTPDTLGRAIYMVDATTGALLWWAGPTGSGADLELTDMSYSIPATPAVIDLNRDGLADQLYVGDMGGQVWRIDFRHGQQAGNFATGGAIASLGGDDEASNRRFYHTPDISGTLNGGRRYLNLAIGSGYQAHPLDKGVQDRFYKLTISSIAVPLNQNGEVEYSTMTESDLFDATDNLIQEGSEAQKEAAETSLAQAKGWYIRLLREGEKVLASSTTLRGDVFFTTFEPSGGLDPCVPSAGQSRLYHVKLRDGRAVVNYDQIGMDNQLTQSDRHVALKTIGLPPSPKAMTINGDDVILAGTETLVPPQPGSLVRKIYWYEE